MPHSSEMTLDCLVSFKQRQVWLSYFTIERVVQEDMLGTFRGGGGLHHKVEVSILNVGGLAISPGEVCWVHTDHGTGRGGTVPRFSRSSLSHSLHLIRKRMLSCLFIMSVSYRYKKSVQSRKSAQEQGGSIVRVTLSHWKRRSQKGPKGPPYRSRGPVYNYTIQQLH